MREHRKTEKKKRKKTKTTNDIRTNTELIFFQIKYKWLYRILRSIHSALIEVTARSRESPDTCIVDQWNTQSRVFLHFIQFLWYQRCERGSRLCLCVLVVRSSDKIRSGNEMNQIRFYGIFFLFLPSEFVSPGILLGWMNYKQKKYKQKSNTRETDTMWPNRKMTDDRY